jgi:hypothetical protein
MPTKGSLLAHHAATMRAGALHGYGSRLWRADVLAAIAAELRLRTHGTAAVRAGALGGCGLWLGFGQGDVLAAVAAELGLRAHHASAVRAGALGRRGGRFWLGCWLDLRVCPELRVCPGFGVFLGRLLFRGLLFDLVLWLALELGGEPCRLHDGLHDGVDLFLLGERVARRVVVFRAMCYRIQEEGGDVQRGVVLSGHDACPYVRGLRDEHFT